MKELVRTVISCGLVDANQVREFQRWGLIDRKLALEDVEQKHEAIKNRMNLALDVVGLDRKESDLSIHRWFLETAKPGKLYVHIDGVDVREPVDVTYGTTKHREYILPWRTVGQEELLVNGRTYLQTQDSKVYMMDSRPVYFDELQSFVVCKPGYQEARDGRC